MDMASLIRTAFRESGLSRFELSKRTAVAYSVIHRFMAEERDLTLNTASKLADELGLELRPARKARKGR